MQKKKLTNKKMFNIVKYVIELGYTKFSYACESQVQFGMPNDS